MKALIVYDSAYGNTEEIARAIGSAIGGDTKALRAGSVNPSELASVDLLIIGSPTQGGRPTQAVQDFLSKITGASLKDMRVAAFDTRVSAKWAVIFGYAAGRIAKALKARGANLAVPPQGFLVKGTKGPLKEGELERASVWAKGIVGTHEGKK